MHSLSMWQQVAGFAHMRPREALCVKLVHAEHESKLHIAVESTDQDFAC